MRKCSGLRRLWRVLRAPAAPQVAIDVVLGRVMAVPPARPGAVGGALGVHRTTMWRLVKAGRLETVELLGSLRVRRADIEALAAGQSDGKEGK